MAEVGHFEDHCPAPGSIGLRFLVYCGMKGLMIIMDVASGV